MSTYTAIKLIARPTPLCLGKVHNRLQTHSPIAAHLAHRT
jgi:hypothetical protein